jgi:hypothetical protein
MNEVCCVIFVSCIWWSISLLVAFVQQAWYTILVHPNSLRKVVSTFFHYIYIYVVFLTIPIKLSSSHHITSLKLIYLIAQGELAWVCVQSWYVNLSLLISQNKEKKSSLNLTQIICLCIVSKSQTFFVFDSTIHTNAGKRP